LVPREVALSRHRQQQRDIDLAVVAPAELSRLRARSALAALAASDDIDP
jgi:hypothetical protein